MSVFQDIRAVSPDMSTAELLRFLLTEKFPGETLVTASLKAPSVVVLKLVADIDPSTPVVFCVRGYQFPESAEYRSRIVDQLGLENVSLSNGDVADVVPGDSDHCEHMWAESRDLPTRSFEIVHLNKTLAPYSCWISAVYHVDNRSTYTTHRVDVESRLIRVNPLIRWSKDDVRAFMREHKLPFHPRASKPKPPPQRKLESPPPSYSY